MNHVKITTISALHEVRSPEEPSRVQAFHRYKNATLIPFDWTHITIFASYLVKTDKIANIYGIYDEDVGKLDVTLSSTKILINQDVIFFTCFMNIPKGTTIPFQYFFYLQLQNIKFVLWGLVGLGF